MDHSVKVCNHLILALSARRGRLALCPWVFSISFAQSRLGIEAGRQTTPISFTTRLANFVLGALAKAPSSVVADGKLVSPAGCETARPSPSPSHYGTECSPQLDSTVEIGKRLSPSCNVHRSFSFALAFVLGSSHRRYDQVNFKVKAFVTGRFFSAVHPVRRRARFSVNETDIEEKHGAQQTMRYRQRLKAGQVQDRQ